MEADSTGTRRDPVTGEMISKQCVLICINLASSSHKYVSHRELKRRQKQREKEARKAENVVNRPPASTSLTDALANEDNLSPNVCRFD